LPLVDCRVRWHQVVHWRFLLGRYFDTLVASPPKACVFARVFRDGWILSSSMLVAMVLDCSSKYWPGVDNHGAPASPYSASGTFSCRRLIKASVLDHFTFNFQGKRQLKPTREVVRAIVHVYTNSSVESTSSCLFSSSY
jgi:hypothetical protein